MDKPFSSYKGDEPYIFISYAHDDQHEVFKHIKRLNQEGFRIWYDEGIEPGVNWYESLESRIRNCECILLFISKKAQQSQYISKEITCAIEHNKHIVCIMLDDESLKGPFNLMLCDTQSIKKSELKNVDRFYEKLADALHPDLTRSNNSKANETISLNDGAKSIKFELNKKNILLVASFILLCCFVGFIYNNSKQNIKINTQDQNIPQSTNIENQQTNSEIVRLVDAVHNHNIEKKIEAINIKIRKSDHNSLSSFDKYIESITLFLNEYKKYMTDVNNLYERLLTLNDDLINQNQKNNYIEHLRSFLGVDIELKDFDKEFSEMLQGLSKFKTNFDVDYRYTVINNAINLYNFSLSSPNIPRDKCKDEYEKKLESTNQSEYTEIKIAYKQDLMPKIVAIFDLICYVDQKILIFRNSYRDIQPFVNELRKKFSHM